MSGIRRISGIRTPGSYDGGLELSVSGSTAAEEEEGVSESEAAGVGPGLHRM